MKDVIVTTSWDDGHTLDARLAALLRKYDISGTFYVSPRDHEFSASELLTDAEVKKLSKSFEIGAHTMSHPRLPKLSDDVAASEIADSKRYLEKVIGKPVTSFCYPGGSYRKRHVDMVRAAGFLYARTVRRHSFGYEGFPYEAETTVNTYNHYSDLWKIAKFARFRPSKIKFYFQWDNLARAMFDRVCERGGVFHLWGHSWEVDGHGDWEKLEDVLRYISGKRHVRYVTNGELPILRPKRVLIAAPYFPPHTGGAEFYSFSIGRLLQQQFGWDVRIVTSGDRGFAGTAQSTYKGLQVYRLSYWLKISNTPVNPLWFFTLPRLYKEERADIIIAHTPVPFLADMAVWARGKIPAVLTYHGLSMQKDTSSVNKGLISIYERFVLPFTLRASSRIVCNTDNVRDNFLAVFRNKSVTISPGVDTSYFTPAVQKLRRPTLLFVGSLDKSNSYKGLSYLFEALITVRQKQPETMLVVTGEGDGRADYTALAKKMGLEHNVTFTGNQYGRELVARFQSAGIFVLPSLMESFGMVVAESMACGLPVVASRVGGIPLLVQDRQTGYLVSPADSSALADKILFLLEHPQTARKFGEAGRKRAASSFDWRPRAEQTNQLLLSCIEEKTA